jgi:hypothetical protein
MKCLMVAIMITACTVHTAAGQGVPEPGTCESKAVGSDGKPLAGGARTSFMNKCKRETCTAKAVGSDGKPLSGAAKASFMTKCLREQA